MDRSLLITFIAIAGLVATNAALAVGPAAPTFGTTKTLPLSSGFGEPSLATAPDGTLYVTAPGSASALWRSDDGGALWLRVSDSLGASGDSDVAIDADGIVYVSDLFSNVPVSTSLDKGETFAYEASTASGGSIDRQWTAASGSGHVFSVWRDGSTERIAVSHDRGVSFTRHVVTTGVGYQGNVLATSDTDLWIPYTGSGQIRLAGSTDAGVTWTTHAVASGASSTLFPAVAVDDAGTVYVAWSAKSNEDLGYVVKLAVSKDGGLTFDGPTTLSADGKTSIFPWIEAGAPGRVAVAWYEGTHPLGMGFNPDVAALTTWVVGVAFSDHADEDGGWSVTAATPILHTGPICTMGTLCFPVANPVASNRMLLDFFEIAEATDGDILITYAADQGVVNTGETVLKFVRQTDGPNLRG